MASDEMKKLYLTDIAEKTNGVDAINILLALIPHSIVRARIDNAEFIVERENRTSLELSSPMLDVIILEEYLQSILRKGSWSGDVMLSSIVYNEGNPDDPEVTVCPMHVSAMDRISISIEDLFVFDTDLESLINKYPDIIPQKPSLSPKEEDNLYALIGVLVDMLVKKEKNAIGYSLPPPEEGCKYIFKSQAALIKYIIEEYGINGLKESSLEDKFSKSNATLLKKI